MAEAPEKDRPLSRKESISEECEARAAANPPVEVPGYQILEWIGEGTFGTVYRARQSSTGQDVAVKLLRSDGMDKDARAQRIARFQRETSLYAELRHPYIVQLMDQGVTADGAFFAIFEYVEGETLQSLLRRKGPLPANQLKTVLGHVLEALAYAHGKGIVHRDLKPGNIMVSTNPVHTYAKVLDFGIGGLLSEAAGGPHDQARPKESLGTPSYAAPEQLRGETSNAKADIYAWGLVFLECLTGQPVMTGATVAEIIQRQLLAQDIPLPPEIALHPIAALLRRALAKRPEDRIGDATRLLSEYHEISLADLAGKTTPAVTDQAAIVADQTAEGVTPLTNWRQLTALCCNLVFWPRSESTDHPEDADSLHRALRSLCADIAAKYGGYHAGSLGGFHMFYFGYPEFSDSDTRLAIRAALDLAHETRRYGLACAELQNHELELRTGIHSGPVLVDRNTPPSGSVSDMAIRLAAAAAAGQVLLSGPCRDRLLHDVDTESIPGLPSFPKDMRLFALVGKRQANAGSPFSQHTVIGRERELALLHKGWQAVKRGQRKFFCIEGKAGIGKSTLVGAAGAAFQQDGASILAARCFPEYQNSGLHPVLEMVRANLGISSNLNPDIQAQRVEQVLEKCGCDVGQIFPTFCLWLSLPLPASHAAPHLLQHPKERFFDALIQILFSQATALQLFIVEDLHWADPTTLEFLDYLARSVDKGPAMVIATARPDSNTPFPEDSWERLKLEELNDSASMELLDSIVESTVLPPDLKRRILDRAGGLPFFIEMLARTVLENNVGKQLDGQQYRAIWNDIPHSLMDLLSAQIHRLKQSRETVQLCSVIGKEWDYDLLAKVSLLPEEALRSDIAELVEAEILTPKGDAGSSTFVFRHALLRDAAYSSMNGPQKKQYHARIAQVLEESLPSMMDKRAVLLAGHHAGAHHFSQAVEVGIEAAKKFLDKASLWEAIRLSLDVLDWIGKCAMEEQPETKLQINGILTQSLMGTQGWAAPAVKERIDFSCRLVDYAGTSSHYGPTLCSLMVYHYVASNRKELRCVCDELMSYANHTSNTSLQIAAHTFSGLWAHGAGRYQEAERSLENVLALYQPDVHGDGKESFGLDTRVWSSATLALVKWFAAKPEEAILCSDNAVQWAREMQHIPSLCIALLYKANLCQYRNDKPQAQEVITELNALANTHGLSAYQAYGQILAFWLAGQAQEAEAVLNTLESMGCTAALSYYRSLLADIYASHAQFDEAITCIETCLLLCEKNDEFYYEPELHRLHGQYLMLQNRDNRELAQASYQKATETAHKMGMVHTGKLAASQWRHDQAKLQKTM